MAKWEQMLQEEVAKQAKPSWERLGEGVTSDDPTERGFFSNVVEAFRRGRKETLSDIAAFEALYKGKGDLERVRRTREVIRKKEALDPIDGNFIEDMVFGSARVLGGMAQGVGEGVKMGAKAGAVAGTAAAVAGQTGPQAMIPEEIATVPGATAGGFRAGYTAGAAGFWYRQGAGAMAMEMIDQGTDPETAKEIAMVSAIPYAAIEFLQVKQLAPGKRKALQKGINNITRKLMGTFVKGAGKYAKTVGTEVLEEDAQEMIQMASEEIAKVARGEGIDLSKEALVDRAMRLYQVSKESAKSMALLPLPGAAVNTANAMDVALKSQAEVDQQVESGQVPPMEAAEAAEGPMEPTEKATPLSEVPTQEPMAPVSGLEQEQVQAPEQMQQQIPRETEQQQRQEVAEVQEAGQTEADVIPDVQQMPEPQQRKIGRITKILNQWGKRRAGEDRTERRVMRDVAEKSFRAGIEQERTKLNQFKQATKIKKGYRKEMRRMVQDYLPVEERGRLLTAIEKAESPKQLTEGIEKLSEVFDKMEKKHEIAKLKKMTALVKKRFGTRKGEFRMLPEIAGPLQGLVESIDMKKPTAKTIEKLQQMQEFIETEEQRAEQEGMLEDPYIKFGLEGAKKAVDRLSRAPVADMAPEAIRQIRNSMAFMVSQQIGQQQLAGQERGRMIQDVLDQAYEEIGNAKNGQKAIEDNEVIDNTKVKRVTGPLKRLFKTGHSNLDALTIVMSGGKEGALHTNIAEEIAGGERRRYEHLYLINDYVRERLKQEEITEEDLKRYSPLMKTSFLKKDKPKTLSVKLESGKVLQMNISTMMDIYMHTLNSDNYTALTGENGVYLRASKSRIPQLTSDDVLNIIEQLPEKAKAVCDIMGEAIKVQQMAVNEVSIRMDGYELATVDNYWHISRKMPKKVAGKEALTSSESIESRSAWKERVGGKQPLMIGDAFNNFVDTIGVGSEYVGLAEPYRNARKILQDSTLQQVAEKKGFKDHLDAMITILNRAQQKRAETTVVGELIGIGTRNVTRAIFSFSPRLAAQQRFSIALALNEFDKKYLAKVKGTVNRKIKNEINEHSPYFRHRFEGYIGREFGAVARTGSVIKFFTGQDMWFNKPTAWVKQNDQAAVTDIWRMAKAEVEDKYDYEKGSQSYWDAVAKRAEYVARKTQPTWEATTRSVIGATKEPTLKALTMFHSQREKIYQMLQIATAEYANSDQKAADLSKLLKTYGLVASNTAGVNLWKTAYNLGTASAFAALIGEASDEEREEFLGDWLINSFADLFGLVYFIGPIARDTVKAVIADIMDKPTRIKFAVPFPATRGIEGLTGAARSGVTFLLDIIEYGEVDTELGAEFMLDTLEAGQYLFGGPLLPLVKWARKWKEEEL